MRSALLPIIASRRVVSWCDIALHRQAETVRNGEQGSVSKNREREREREREKGNDKKKGREKKRRFCFFL